MSFSGMLPLHFATVDLGPLGEQVIVAGGVIATVVAGLWAAWTRPQAQPVPVRVPSRRNPPRR
ncbi:hypothetical protein HPC49_51990 [Pyxidicoccus fallax]|jgi:hypothetical protein|uniref:Uncharacterized protein n=1 Tax=Pyxidicoccus fallax TaxID=394095 RepID=A0A848LG89_9BACT|nr:hypothetical protein [Pyxidicoccus fallax]NMO16383.1 hypothetical protein [Pyxidicoccus fallax]NPC86696.1 hypothetical protein [Pyxidicoccus fallax]